MGSPLVSVSQDFLVGDWLLLLPFWLALTRQELSSSLFERYAIPTLGINDRDLRRGLIRLGDTIDER
jgi:hypothetical protein